MKSTIPHVLTINAGSSSIKFALFADHASLEKIAHGEIKRIGFSDATFEVQGIDSALNVFKQIMLLEYTAAVQVLMEWIEELYGSYSLVAVGHRIVHGGLKYVSPEMVSLEMLQELQLLSSFDPEHMPGELLLIKTFQDKFPKVPQICCFDTEFHHNLPRVAKVLPIPRYLESKGVRKYGFHGISYEFLLEELTRIAGSKASLGRVIFAHLGNGASLAAVKNGIPVDTSMSFTPASGIPMSTRSGDLDPGLSWYLLRTQGFDTKRFNTMINCESGLLGMSEISSDMQDLLQKEHEDERAFDAIAVFCYHVKKMIGSFAAVLGGIDTLVFAGGIGENSSKIRSGICEGLEFLEIKLNSQCNEENKAIISSGRVVVRVMHTDEEWMIAKKVLKSLKL